MSEPQQTSPIDPNLLTPLIEFRDVWHEGAFHSFTPDELYALLLLQRHTNKRVSYERAFRGWKNAPLLGERRSAGRALYSWLEKHKLSIIWKESDFYINPLLTSPLAPRHDKDDEYAINHSFVIRPQMVNGRKIKLYVQDRDMIKLLNLHLGEAESLDKLTQGYITQRLKWADSHVPAPTFLDWIIATGKKPHISEGELGFFPLLSLGPS